MPEFRQNLPDAKLRARGEINGRIGAVRRSFITDLPAQEIAYSNKEAEALRYIMLPEPPADLTGFPYLAAETGFTAPTPLELATLWLTMAGQWEIANQVIEGIRSRHLALVEQAVSVGATRDQVAAFAAELDAALAALRSAAA
ncbi:hypothetical protein [Wenxinia saemankumensis]|uniref:Uncharacterized protein n=1 Tax=Wenxinia saemankumensis TaxID=1447782 RepID=A0A1M6F0P7_9RHOB|nr:hypothetical protein [Wenxinia saemankumensis]SHI91226.1 hypothetical protein SAMN05444417_2285 [Wenxinia saemankumensis]